MKCVKTEDNLVSVAQIYISESVVSSQFETPLKQGSLTGLPIIAKGLNVAIY